MSLYSVGSPPAKGRGLDKESVDVGNDSVQIDLQELLFASAQV